MKKDLKQIQNKIIPLLKANGVVKASIFGSYVTGKNTKKSDVDILVELNSDFGLFEFSGLKIALEKRLMKQVDLVEYGAIRPELKQSILKNHVRIL